MHGSMCTWEVLVTLLILSSRMAMSLSGRFPIILYNFSPSCRHHCQQQTQCLRQQIPRSTASTKTRRCRAPLITDPPPTSSTNLSERSRSNGVLRHITCDMPFIRSFDPYWVVWFHTSLATYYINKWMHTNWFICTKYIINELFISRSNKLSIKK